MTRLGVIFDLDGTLADTAEGIINAFRQASIDMGLPSLRDDELEGLIGPPIRNSFMRLYDLTAGKASEAAEAFRKRYASPERLSEASLYPGVPELLECLANEGYCLGVATNKREDCAKEMLASFGLINWLSSVRGSLPGTFEQKDAIVSRAIADMKDAGVDTYVMVGDTESDRTAAITNEIGFIAVTYGFGFNPGSNVPSAFTVVDDTASIRDAVRKIPCKIIK